MSKLASHRLLCRLTASLLFASLATGCADTISVIVAPRLGQTTECLEYFPLPKPAAEWLARHPELAPPEWYQWEDWHADTLNPKLERDCE